MELPKSGSSDYTINVWKCIICVYYVCFLYVCVMCVWIFVSLLFLISIVLSPVSYNNVKFWFPTQVVNSGFPYP